MIEYKYVLEQFQKYANNLNTKDKEIAIKVSHSYHVADLAGKLAKRMELDEEKTEIVKTMALLHDIGRFIQYSSSGSYNDEKTKINHAEAGDLYLFVEDHRKDFGIQEEYIPVIRIALINHNKLKIEENLNEEEIFYCKFLRDIDKIDIFRQEATSYEWTYGEVTKEVEKDFEAHHLVDKRKIKTKADELIAELAYLFDINFKESYELLKDTDNLELFLSVVEVKREYVDKFDNIKKEVREFLEDKVK